MAETSLHAVIAGAGPTGLTAALALAQAGWRVSVIEQAPVMDEVGAGLQIPPNASRILQKLGVMDHLRPLASEPAALHIRRGRDGAVLARRPDVAVVLGQLQRLHGHGGHGHRDGHGPDGGMDGMRGMPVGSDELAAAAVAKGELKWVSAVVTADNPEALRSLGSQVLHKLGEGVVRLGAAFGDKASVVAFCSPAAIKAGHQAGKIINELSQKLGGKGGGKPDFAMGGGKDAAKLAEVFQA